MLTSPLKSLFSLTTKAGASSTVVPLHWWLLVAIFLLSGVTALTTVTLERFLVVDGELLKDPEFLQGDKYWSARGGSVVSFSAPGIELRNSANGNGEVEQDLNIGGPGYLRLSIKAESGQMLPASDKYYAGGSVVLKLFDETGTTLRHEMAAILKTQSEAARYEKDIMLSDAVSSVRVSVRLLSSAGDFNVESLQLNKLKESLAFRCAKWFLLFCWCILSFIVAFYAFKILSIGNIVALVATLFLVVALVLAPASFITSINNYVYQGIPPFLKNGIDLLFVKHFGLLANTAAPSAVISKLGHVFLFMLLGFVIGRGYRLIGIFCGMTMILAVAVASEVLQLFASNRTPHLRDIMLDLVGGYVGFGLALTAAFVWQSFWRESDSSPPE